jgi:UPF0176 protein
VTAPHPGAFLAAALYQFVELPDCAALRGPLQSVCEAQGVKGTLLLAPEGINGTIAGPPQGVRAVLAHLRTDPRLAHLDHKESWSDRAPFLRMKVRVKKEIVTLGVPGVNPVRVVGTYVKPAEWNALISQPDVLLVDTRNDYEVDIGSFAGAVNPQIKTFADLPDWLAEQERQGALTTPDGQRKKVAMFCTGGIRCEKSTAYLKMQGYDEVYHLQGGILKYLEEVPAERSLWHGGCFVFDERVSVGHGLVVGEHSLCRSCRHPLGPGERSSPQFVPGVSCPHCAQRNSAERKQHLMERQHQVELAAQRQQTHVGARPAPKAEVELPLLADPVGRLVALAQATPDAVPLLALIGMPGSGKSTLARLWCAEVNRRLACPEDQPAMVVLGMDGFHWPKAALQKMPNPSLALTRRGAPWTFDAKSLAAALQLLKGHARELSWPAFDHGRGDPQPATVQLPPSVRVVLVEGLYLLHNGDGWACRKLFDEAWYVDVPTDVARSRTIARHMQVNRNTQTQAEQRWRGNDRINATTVRKTRPRAAFRVLNPDTP